MEVGNWLLGKEGGCRWVSFRSGWLFLPMCLSNSCTFSLSKVGCGIYKSYLEQLVDDQLGDLWNVNEWFLLETGC